MNEIVEDDSGQPQLRFYAYLGAPGGLVGGDERQAQAALDSQDHGFQSGILSTLARIRTLAEEGTLTA